MPGGHSHSHAHGSHASSAKVPVSSLARVGLTVFLVLVAAATVFGVVRYWPGDSRTPNQVGTADFAAPGVTFPIAEVQKVLPVCEGADSGTRGQPSQGQGGEVAGSEATCGAITVQLE